MGLYMKESIVIIVAFAGFAVKTDVGLNGSWA